MPNIEYFFSTHSGYAYLGSARFQEIAKAAGREIDHKPIDLRKVVSVSGAVPFGERSAARGDYFFRREIERWSEERNAPVATVDPTHHANEIATSSSMVIAAQLRGLDVTAFVHALLEMHWRDNGNLADRLSLVRIAGQAGFDGEALLSEGASETVAAQYAANTQEAIDRFVFGSPTYFVDGDMFYGQDRLEMVERALRKPYAGRCEISE